MRRVIFCLSFVGILCFMACRDDNSLLGQSLVESSFRNVLVDTCTVDISTIYMDSMVTRGDTICQIGHYKDSIWGEVYATYYAEFSTVSFTPTEDHSYRLDSLVLRLKHSGHFWGDTLTPQRIAIHQLRNPIDLSDDEDLYNHTSLPLEETPLYTFSLNPRPSEDEEVTCASPTNGEKNYWNAWWPRMMCSTAKTTSSRNSPASPLCPKAADSASPVSW